MVDEEDDAVVEAFMQDRGEKGEALVPQADLDTVLLGLASHRAKALLRKSHGSACRLTEAGFPGLRGRDACRAIMLYADHKGLACQRSGFCQECRAYRRFTSDTEPDCNYCGTRLESLRASVRLEDKAASKAHMKRLVMEARAVLAGEGYAEEAALLNQALVSLRKR